MEKEIKKVVIYTRVSTQEQAEDGFSLDNQKVDLEKHCEKFEYIIEKHFTDEGITGSSIEKREGLKKMLKFVDKNQIDAILIWKLSRISRNSLDLLNILDYLEKRNIALISIKDNLDTSTSMGKFFIKIAGVFAEMERDSIITQITGGMRQRARQGLWNGGVAPFGYSLKDKMLVVNEEESKVIKTIFNLYCIDDFGYTKIVKYLKENGINNRNGKVFNITYIRTILSNPIYIGKIKWGELKGWSKNRRKGKTENYILEKGKHDAIISEQLFNKVQEKMKENVKEIRKHSCVHLLSGLAKCPVCGSAMIFYRTTSKRKDGSKKEYFYYACNRWNSNKIECSSNLVKADLLEKQVIEEISNFTNNKNIIQEINNRVKENSNLKEQEKKLKELDNNILKLNRRSKKLREMRMDDEISKEEFIIDKEELDLQIEELTSIKLEIEKSIKNIKDNKMTAEKVAYLLQNFSKVFVKSEMALQRELLHQIIKEIKITKANTISERKAEEIIFAFNEQDIMKYTQKGQKKNVCVRDDKVNRTISK